MDKFEIRPGMILDLPPVDEASQELVDWRWNTMKDKEPETIAWIDSFLWNPWFIDVGANIGIYSAYAATRTGRRHLGGFDLGPARAMPVISIEPNWRNALYLSELAQANGLNNIVVCLGCAASTSGQYPVPIYTPGNRIGAAEIICPAPKATINKDRDYAVHTKSIDDIMPLPTDTTRSIYIKIDVDGAEVEVLAGALNTLQSPLCKSVLVEGSPQTAKAVAAIMQKCGFQENKSYYTMPNHSNHRRMATGNDVRNVIWDKR